MDFACAPRLGRYLSRVAAVGTRVDPAAAAVLAALDHLSTVAPSVAEAIAKELRDQRGTLKLIASENTSSLAVQLAQGNWLTDIKLKDNYFGFYTQTRIPTADHADIGYMGGPTGQDPGIGCRDVPVVANDRRYATVQILAYYQLFT